MRSRREFYTQAFVVAVIGAFAVSLIIVFFAQFNIKVSDSWSVSYAPWLEEGIKYFFVLILLSTVTLNIKAIPFIGLGFAIVEAVRHIELTGYASPRAFLAHLVFGLIMALFLYWAINSRDKNIRGVLFAVALLAPVALHLIYNIYLG